MLSGWKACVHSEHLRLEAPGEGPTSESIFVNMVSCFYLCSQSQWLAVDFLVPHLPGPRYNGYNSDGSELDIGRQPEFWY